MFPYIFVEGRNVPTLEQLEMIIFGPDLFHFLIILKIFLEWEIFEKQTNCTWLQVSGFLK